MAALRKIFLKGVETLFNTFEEAVKIGTYNLDTDNGFDVKTTATDTIRCIFENFTEKDVELLTFSKLIQPKDIKGLVPYVDLINNKDKVSSQGYCIFDSVQYEVVAFDLDPMAVIYTILLRKN
jgi:hypothetical protein